MIDLTGLRDMAADAGKDDKEVAELAARRILDALRPYNGRSLSKSEFDELNNDLSEIAQMLYDNNRLAAFQGLRGFLTRLFGGGCGCGGDDGGGGCGGGGCGGDDGGGGCGGHVN